MLAIIRLLKRERDKWQVPKHQVSKATSVGSVVRQTPGDVSPTTDEGATNNPAPADSADHRETWGEKPAEVT